MRSSDIFTYNEKRTFVQRFGFPLVVGGVVIIAAIFGYQLVTSKAAPPRRPPSMVMITPLQPPPPTPPPPPPPPLSTPSEAPKEQMLDQPAVIQEESKPAEAPAPEAGLGTNVTGPGGPDGFGLGRSGNGVIGGTGNGSRGGGSRFGWYAAQVQRTIADALRGHPKTRNASFVATVRIWADTTGRVTRARLAQTTGDAAVDRALADEILPNLQLQEPPPPDLPMPFVTRLMASRPN